MRAFPDFSDPAPANTDPATTDWRHFPCSATDPTAWIEGRTLASHLPPAAASPPPPRAGGRRRTSLFAFLAPAAARGSWSSSAGSAGGGSPLWRPGGAPAAADPLEARLRALLGLPADGPLDRPPDCRVRRFRRGERVLPPPGGAEAGGGGAPLAVVLRGLAVVAAGASVVDRVGPGGCLGGAQFVLQASARSASAGGGGAGAAAPPCALSQPPRVVARVNLHLQAPWALACRARS